MPKEMFPQKSRGDGLSATHVNDLGRVVTNLSGGNQGSGQQGSSGWITGSAIVQKMTVVIAKIIEETSESGIYEITLRYWDETNRLWKDHDDEYLLDARCFSSGTTYPQVGMTLSAGQRLSVRYDKQRGMFVPIAEPGSGGAEIISFRVLASGPFYSEIDVFCLRIRCEVVAVSCQGATVSVGDEIDVWDPNGTFFSVPIDILLNMIGTASKMAWDSDVGIPGDCFRDSTPEEIAALPYAGQCWWNVVNMSCVEEWYDSPY